MRFTVTLRNILLMATTAAFMPLVGADYYIPTIQTPDTGSTLKAGTRIRITWDFKVWQAPELESITGTIRLCSGPLEPQCSGGIGWGHVLVQVVRIPEQSVYVTLPDNLVGRGYYLTFEIILPSGVTLTTPLGYAWDLTITR